MSLAILLIVGIPLLIYSVRHTVLSFQNIREKNKTVPQYWKRMVNWPLGLIWSACLLTFSIGLLVNNLWPS